MPSAKWAFDDVRKRLEELERAMSEVGRAGRITAALTNDLADVERLQRQGYEVVDLEAYVEEMGDVMPLPPRAIAARELAESEDIMDNEVRRLLGHGHTGVWVEFYSCPSNSNPKNSYIVSKSKYDTWGCSCPRWIFHREDCRHIQRVTAALHNPGYAIHTEHINSLDTKTRRALGRIARVEVEVTAGSKSLGDDNEGSERAARLEL